MENYIQQLIADQGITNDIDPEVREQLTQELTTRANNFLNQRLLDAMSDDAVEHFNTTLDSNTFGAEQIQQFIDVNLPQKDKIVAAALLEFRALYLGSKA